MSKNNLGGFQVLGLIITLIGFSLFIFPTFIGFFALRVITLVFVIFGFYGFIFAAMIRNVFSILTAMFVLIISVYAFLHPTDLLFLAGISFIISGVNGLIMSLKHRRFHDESTLISSIVMILLGVFAVLNAKATLSTIVMILGLIITILGLVIFFTGKKFSLHNARFFYTTSSHVPPEKAAYSEPKERVYVNIDDDDIEEGEFKDL